MTTFIQDGSGTGNRAKVSGNRLFTHSITELETVHATEQGMAYNLNTDIISLTGTADSGVLYLVNNEAQDLLVTAIAVGIGSGTASDPALVTLVRNPTGGDIVDTGTAVAMNQNRDFGSSRALAATVYKGTDGDSMTGGNEIAMFYQSHGGRLFADIDFLVPKGESLGIKVDPNLTSGSCNIYAAVICHVRDENFLG